MNPRSCKHCGIEFIPGSGAAKYCIPCRVLVQKERNAARAIIGNIPCDRCGQVFNRNGSNGRYCKKCKPIVEREWFQKSNIKWKAEHREENRELNREYMQKRRESDIANGCCPDCREPHDSNFIRCDACRERHNEIERTKRKQPERQKKIREYAIEYDRTHAPNRRINVRNRRARIHGNGGKLPPNVESILFESQDGLCYLCGKLLYNKFDDLLCIEHKIPVCRGGPNTLSNVGLAHMSCNYKKGTKTVEEYVKLAV